MLRVGSAVQREMLQWSSAAAPPILQRPTATRLLLQLDAVAADRGDLSLAVSDRGSGDAIARLERELASLRATTERCRRAKRLSRTSLEGGVANAHGSKHYAGVGGRATRALFEAVHEVDSALESLLARPSPSSAAPRSPAFSPVSSPEILVPPSPSPPRATVQDGCTVAAFCGSAVAEDSKELARPEPRRSTTPERPHSTDGKSQSQVPAPMVGSPGRQSAFSSPAVAPRPPSKRRPSGDGSERRRAGREAILRALIESGVSVSDGDGVATHSQQQQGREQTYIHIDSAEPPTAGHPHKGLIRQLESHLAQQRPDPGRVLRLAERLLAAAIAAFAGAAGDHNTGGGTLALDILVVPELRERVMCHLKPRDLCRCRRVSRQLMMFGDEALAKIRALASGDWGGIAAFQLERRLPLCAPNLTTISWDGSPLPAGPSGPASAAAVLTDDMLRVAARAAGPSLRALSLRNCGRLSECGLLAVAEYCGAGLTTLELRGCVGLTDACLNLLSERCSALRSVDLSDSALITDAAVGLLLARCPLTTLCLSRCASITDDTVAHLVGYTQLTGRQPARSQLQRLDLRGCRGITGESCELLASLRASAYAHTHTQPHRETGPAETHTHRGTERGHACVSLASTLHWVGLTGTNSTDEEQRLVTQTLQQHQSF